MTGFCRKPAKLKAGTGSVGVLDYKVTSKCKQTQYLIDAANDDKGQSHVVRLVWSFNTAFVCG